MTYPQPAPFMYDPRLGFSQHAAALRQMAPAHTRYAPYLPPHGSGPELGFNGPPMNSAQDQRSHMGQHFNNRGTPSPNPSTNPNPNGNQSASSSGPATMDLKAKETVPPVADPLDWDNEADEHIATPPGFLTMDAGRKRRRLSLLSLNPSTDDEPKSQFVTEHIQHLEQKILGLESRLQSQEEKFEKSIKELQETLVVFQAGSKERQLSGQRDNGQGQNRPDHFNILLIPANGTPPRIVTSPVVEVESEGEGDAGLNRLPDIRSVWGKEGWSCRKVIRMSFVNLSLAIYDINDFYYILKSTDDKNLLRNPHFDAGVWGDVCIMRRANLSMEEDGPTTFANVSPNVLLVDYWTIMFKDAIQKA